MAQNIHYFSSVLVFYFAWASPKDSLNQVGFKSGQFQFCNQAPSAASKGQTFFVLIWDDLH